MLAAVEDQRGEVGDRRACREGAAVRVCSDLFEDAALDSASKTTDTDPGVADLARRDRAVLTCRNVRQPRATPPSICVTAYVEVSRVR
jgi:hypothetical protein